MPRIFRPAFPVLLFLALFANARLAAQTELAVYIDSSHRSQYYYSFNYLLKTLRLDGFATSVQSLSRLGFKMEYDHIKDSSLKTRKQKIYLVVIYQNHLESYQQILEFIDRQYRLILWVLTPQNLPPFALPSGFELDTTTSASTADAFLSVFRAEVFPRIMSLYTAQ